MKLAINIIWVGALLLITDAIGWWAWAMSGQIPVDGWYIGTVTNQLVHLMF